MNKTNYIAEAKFMSSIGVSVIPVRIDGSKLPSIRWKEFQTRIMTDEEIDHHFFNCGGVIAITGKVSRLLCIDFDLDKERETDDFWKMFMCKVPNEMKHRMLINRTRSGGFHVWVRTDYEDKSRKITHRPLTIPEISDRYEVLLENGANEETASMMLLKKPVECVIETRSKGSYGVFQHAQYSRFFGESIGEFSKDEVDFLLNIGYSLDFNYKKPKVYTGKVDDYKIIAKFNKDATAEGVTDMLEKSGMFTFYDIDSSGNIRLSRVGSSSPYSAYVYKGTGVLHIFGLNPITEDNRNTLFPFEVFTSVNGFDESEAIQILKKHYA
tara:strand:- start:4008 stop:4982 length:975 start_codon:yes stop_codon:yes gene_type:complete